MTALTPTLRPAPSRIAANRLELALAILLAVAAAMAAGPRPLLAGLLWLAGVTPRLVAVDSAEHRLPDAIVLPGIPIALGAVLLDGGVDGSAVATALPAAAAYAGVLLVLHLAGGMGFGDVKLALPLGLLAGALGPAAALASPTVAFLAGGIASLVVLQRHGRGARLAFGPPMLLGAWAAVLLVR